MTATPTRVVVAEDQTVLRRALSTVLALNGFDVVAEAGDGDEALSAIRTHEPHVAVLDIDMPKLDGISVARRVRAELPSCRLLLLTGLPRASVATRIKDADVDGALLKSATPDEIVDVIRRINAGDRVVDTELDAVVDDRSPLTAREAEVLAVAADGKPIRELARSLHLSSSTVRNHLSSAISKTHTRNRLEAINVARELGWI